MPEKNKSHMNSSTACTADHEAEELAELDRELEAAICHLKESANHPHLVAAARAEMLRGYGALDIINRLSELLTAAGVAAVGIIRSKKTPEGHESLAIIESACAKVNKEVADLREAEHNKEGEEEKDNSAAPQC
jgi:hypothetical protein